MNTDLAVREQEAFAELEQAAGLPSGSVKLVGLELIDPDMTFEQWETVGRIIGSADRWTKFALGDWINFGEALFGEQAADAVEGTVTDRYDVAHRVTGLKPETLMNYASVCGRVPRSRRRIELHFSTHEAVAALEPEEQTEWLQKAVDNGWGRDELRAGIREAKGLTAGSPDPEPDPEPGLTISERIEHAARIVVGQAQVTSDGEYLVPPEAMAQLRSSLGME